MKENEIKVFIKVITDYFGSVTGGESLASMGVPFIKDAKSKVFSYTAIIGISGSRKGGIFFTTERPLLEDIAFHILGEKDVDEPTIMDLVGEMTNVIAGNLRETFGSSFFISVPIIMKGKIE
ncbi:MAG: chemotaxis protein CheX [Spirochaetia bacterium]|jgi:chemotaxis protein CheX|nr:chemotaxis protein CheX [Spirochaetia bacterium]